MLFTVKRHAVRSLGLALALVVLVVVAQRTLGLGWSLDASPSVVLAVVGGLLAVFLSDALVHGAMLLAAGDAYRRTFRELVDYYQDQSPGAILAGGLLGAAEELLFRGIVLLGLLQVAAAPEWLAVVAAAVLFGAAHYVPTRRLRPLVPWAVLEGAILGGLLLVTGSLLVPVVVHALHDVLGFALFAWLRRRQ